MADLEDLQHEALQETGSESYDLPAHESLELITLDKFKDERIEGYIQKALRETRTEPALLATKNALVKRGERERLFSRANPDDAPGYLLSIKAEILDRLDASLFHSIEIGKLLLDAKQVLHGRFSVWVPENFKFSLKTAENLIRMYQTTLGIEEVIPFLSKSRLIVISRVTFPKALREYVFNHAAEGVYEAPAQEFLEVGLKFADGKLGLDSPEVRNLVRRRKKTALSDRIIIILNKINPTLNTCRKVLEEMRKECVAEPLLPAEESKRDPIELRSAIRFLDELDGLLAGKIKRLRKTDTLDEDVFDQEAVDSEAEASDIAKDEVIEADSIEEYPGHELTEPVEPVDMEDKAVEVESAVESIEEAAAAGFEESEELSEHESMGMEEEAAGAPGEEKTKRKKGKGRGRSKPTPAEHTKFEEAEEHASEVEIAAELDDRPSDTAVEDSETRIEPAEAVPENMEEADNDEGTEAKSNDEGTADNKDSSAEDQS